MDRSSARILIVDDEQDIRTSFAMALAEAYPDLAVATTGSPKEALSWARQGRFDLVVSDYVMPEMDGIWLLSEIKRGHSDTRTVLVSAYWTQDLAQRAAEIGQIDRVIGKPVDVDDLTDLVRDMLPASALRR